MATQCSGDVHLSIKWPDRVYTDLPINFDKIVKTVKFHISYEKRSESVDEFLLNLFFQLVLGTKFIQETNTVMTLVLLEIVELQIRKS